MVRVGTVPFTKDKHYEEIVENKSLAIRTKMDAIINWNEAESWEAALSLA